MKIYEHKAGRSHFVIDFSKNVHKAEVNVKEMSLSMDDSNLRRERRAKMAELQRKLDPTVADNVRTSAPSVRQVDMWRQEFAAAARKEGTEQPVPAPRKDRQTFYGGGSRNVRHVFMFKNRKFS